MTAANRANAQKSTGPRTRTGKAEVALNALQHGAYTDRFFRSHLVLAHEDVALYDWIYRQICEHFCPVGKAQWARAERLARQGLVYLPEGLPGELKGRPKGADEQHDLVPAADSDVLGRVWNKAGICREISR
jgi:hypothetical protein